MKYFLILLNVFITSISFGQHLSLNSFHSLGSQTSEPSGALYLNGKTIVHNDSGGENKLYQIDPSTGSLIRQVTINGATNVDWEDLCADDQYIYIGDIGNNAKGNRTNLRIYRVSIADFENEENTSIDAEIIPFAYKDQNDFDAHPNNSTDFDAEGLISYNDSLYIFTKNWLTYGCKIYSVPKTPSPTPYLAARVDSFYANGLVTGADYNPETHAVILCAYNLSGGILNAVSYIINIDSFSGNQFSKGSITSRQINLGLSSPQIEGVTFIDGTHFYLTAEQVNSFVTLPAWVGYVEWNGDGYPVNVEHEVYIHPNPANQWVQYSGMEPLHVSIYNYQGQLLAQSSANPLDISEFPDGLLVLRFTNSKGKLIDSRVLKKE